MREEKRKRAKQDRQAARAKATSKGSDSDKADSDKDDEKTEEEELEAEEEEAEEAEDEEQTFTSSQTTGRERDRTKDPSAILKAMSQDNRSACEWEWRDTSLPRGYRLLTGVQVNVRSYYPEDPTVAFQYVTTHTHTHTRATKAKRGALDISLNWCSCAGHAAVPVAQTP